MGKKRKDFVGHFRKRLLKRSRTDQNTDIMHLRLDIMSNLAETWYIQLSNQPT